ncbi:MAG: hypothetical protein SV686_15660 [Thermodesulfobacteriota bacterium]|nr:hypothetical protein [Thermodesulfobacteriota bacterium]
MNTKSLIVSPKIHKTGKFILTDILAKLHDTIDNIEGLFYGMWHCETGVRVSDIVGIKRKGRERRMGQEVRNTLHRNPGV